MTSKMESNNVTTTTSHHPRSMADLPESPEDDAVVSAFRNHAIVPFLTISRTHLTISLLRSLGQAWQRDGNRSTRSLA